MACRRDPEDSEGVCVGVTKGSHLLPFVGREVLKFPPLQGRKSRHGPGLPP